MLPVKSGETNTVVSAGDVALVIIKLIWTFATTMSVLESEKRKLTFLRGEFGSSPRITVSDPSYTGVGVCGSKQEADVGGQTMGLPWSAENILSWRSQFDRLYRWSDRLRELGTDETDQDRLDFYLAFFLNCYALRDWFINSGVVSKPDMDNLIHSNDSMRLCRDVCNRSKHLTLKSPPSTEAVFSIGREYSPYGNRFFVIVLGKKRDLFKVAAACVSFWDDFLKTQRPAEPPNPFH